MTAPDAQPVAFGASLGRTSTPRAPTGAVGLAPVAGFVCLPRAVLLAPGLSRDARLLYAVLLSYAWQQGSCFPGRERLQAALGCGHHQLSAYLRELEGAALITRRRRGPGRTTLYTLCPLTGSPNAPAPNGSDGAALGLPGRRPGGTGSRARGMPRRQGEAPAPPAAGSPHDIAEASPHAAASPPSTLRPARCGPHDGPEPAPVMGLKPAADKDTEDQDAADQQPPPPGQEATTTAEAAAGVVALLAEQGVTRRVAEALAIQHPPAAIRRQVDCHRYRVTGIGLFRNPAGALVQAIRQEWAPPAAWTATQARVATLARHAEAERQREADEKARQREQVAKPPEERIAGRLQFWVLGQRRKGQEPSEAELASRRAALLAELVNVRQLTMREPVTLAAEGAA